MICFSMYVGITVGVSLKSDRPESRPYFILLFIKKNTKTSE